MPESGCWLFLWNFKKQGINHFLIIQPSYMALLQYVVVSSPQCGEKYSLFLRFSPRRDPLLRHFSGYPFGVSRKKTSTIFITQPSILSFMRPFVPVRRRSATLQSQFLSTSGMCMAPCRTARQPVPDKSFFALSQSHSG